MRWFDNWFARQCKKAWEGARDSEDYDTSISPSKSSRRRNKLAKLTSSSASDDVDMMNDRQCYSLKMQTANGGTVIQVSHYDDNKDEWSNDLYVVDDNKDLGVEITSILVQYRLRHI